MCCRVTVDTEIACDLLEFASTGCWKKSHVGEHADFYEFLLCSEGVGDLVEILVASIRLDETSIDCDDSCWSGHLELEVSVVWDDHEFGERWLTEYRVVLGLPVYHLEVKFLPSEVVSVFEDNV